MEKEYKYDAFISYRHSSLDKYVAENLHKVLETYELPKNVKNKLGIKGRTIKRVFRDQDELPLSSNLEDPIVDALNNSKYLIVICSPRLKESLWCKKEIETFKKLRGRKNIFCVLVEGEPNESFPEDVLYDEVAVTDKNGKKKKEKVLVEPLAADVRGENRKEILSKIKDEKLRLIAPMYNLDYDDLKQRHRQRKMKKIIYTSAIVSSLCVLFTIYSLVMLLKISSQQKTLKLHQALSLAEDSYKYLENDDRLDAVKASYDALTEFKGVKMPYTPEAEYALSESLGVYNAGTSYKAVSELKTKGVVDYIKTSSDDKYALTIDESEEITLWDIDKLVKLTSLSDVNIMAINDDSFTFIGLDKFAYINNKGSVVIVDIKTGKVLKEIKKVDFSYKSISSDKDGNYLAINDSPNLYLYKLDGYKEIAKYSFDKKDTLENEMRFTLDGKKLFVATCLDTFNVADKIKSTVHVFDTGNLKEENKFVIDARYIETMIEKGSNIYLLTNQSSGNNYQTLVISYNYQNHKVNWSKTIDNSWGKDIIYGYSDKSNSLAVVHGNLVDIYNINTGEHVRNYNVSTDIIGIYASSTNDIFLAFATDGTANFLSMDYKENIIYKGLFDFNLNKYSFVIKNNSGYLLVPYLSNRIIFYEQNKSKKIKELDKKYDLPKDDGIKIDEYEKIKKDFNIKNKNLVKKIMYADNKNVLVVSYNDKQASFYNVKDKKYLNTIKDVDEINHDFGKDKEGRLYLGGTSNAYIIDKDFNKVGHIESMAHLDQKNNKVVISNSGKYYELPIYSLDELLKEAKSFLNNK